VSEITSTDRNNQPNDTVTENSTEIVTDNEMFVDTETYNIVDYIIAIYENKWNVDKIVDTDPEDESGFMYNVSFKNGFEFFSNSFTLFSWNKFELNITHCTLDYCVHENDVNCILNNDFS
jgi:hypothetical protein